jgi:hypothetical protein
MPPSAEIVRAMDEISNTVTHPFFSEQLWSHSVGVDMARLMRLRLMFG